MFSNMQQHCVYKCSGYFLNSVVDIMYVTIYFSETGP